MTMNLGDMWEAVADALGDEVALIHGERRETYREFEERAGASRRRRSRRTASRHGAKVAIYLYNANEYLETLLRGVQAARRAGERELPLPRRRAALPARQRRRRGARSTTARSPSACRRCATALPKLRIARPGRRPPTPTASRCCPARSTTRSSSPRTSRRRASSARPTIWSSSTPAAPPACRRASCGATATSSRVLLAELPGDRRGADDARRGRRGSPSACARWAWPGPCLAAAPLMHGMAWFTLDGPPDDRLAPSSASPSARSTRTSCGSLVAATPRADGA